MYAVYHFMNIYRTDLSTFSTVHAQILFKHNRISCFQALRIGTPLTSKRAALKEHQSSYAGSVIGIIFLFVKYKRLSFYAAFLFIIHIMFFLYKDIRYNFNLLILYISFIFSVVLLKIIQTIFRTLH